MTKKILSRLWTFVTLLDELVKCILYLVSTSTFGFNSNCGTSVIRFEIRSNPKLENISTVS